MGKLIDTPGDGNLTEIASLMRQGLDHVAAKLASSITPEGHSSFRCRLETVARLATSLLNDQRDFRQAAKDAIALLDAYTTVVVSQLQQRPEPTGRKKYLAQMQKTLPQAADLDFESPRTFAGSRQKQGRSHLAPL